MVPNVEKALKNFQFIGPGRTASTEHNQEQ